MYEARGLDQTRIQQSILHALDKIGERLVSFEAGAIGDLQRVWFPLTTIKRTHARMQKELASAPGIDKLLTFRDPEED
jgi:hypothetical protein